MNSVGIVGTGRALPDEIVTNVSLQPSAGVSDEWIVARTGIRERRRAGLSESASTLGAKAALAAMENASISPNDLDLIICTTVTPDMPMPSTACLIQHLIEARKAVCFDLAAACSGFIFGLEVAEKMIRSSAYRNALVVSVDLLTRWVDYSDGQTCALFGDGAGAAVLDRVGAGRGVLGTKVYSDGAGADLVYIGPSDFGQAAPAELCRAKLRMSGKKTFKAAVYAMASAATKLLDSLAIGPHEIDLIVPHQANKRISDAVADHLQMPREKFFSNISNVGNTAAASIPIALDECVRTGRITKGSLVLLTAFGSGATSGASVVKF